VFHLDPAEREPAGVSEPDLRAAFRADIRSGDDRRKELVGASFGDLDLSALVVDGPDLTGIRFRDVRVTGTLDLSGAIVGHPVTFEDCAIARLEFTDATVEKTASIIDSTLGAPDTSRTSLTARRSTFEGDLDVSNTELRGPAEFAACTVEGWFDVEGSTFGGRAHFPRVSLSMAQILDTRFEEAVEFADATVDHATLHAVRFAERVDLSDAAFGTLRSTPTGDTTVNLRGATVSSGRLDQPDDGRALYDLTEATVGDLDLDCTPSTFDRYRFYRTGFSGFPFAAYRDLLRANGWRIHDYLGDAPDDVEDLEITYLKAKQGATSVGDNESAAAFFIREMEFRRGRYARHALDAEYATTHRAGAAVRWATNAFLGGLAGYGERPGRVLFAALVVILGSGVAYPALGGLDAGAGIVTYASDGVGAALDGIYFSVVTFTTLGLGDVEPVGSLARLVVGTEALAGAFLTALFVFALGRSVTR
jgi:uncharacterized protein YjbI with pentapeptide repeats